ncbi:MAG: recombinase family protein [Bacillus sp. (in: Bacteria)]|nr:recombinase family protein [Bacillus sp. (in: firmicutes)]MCM1427323.1 recombinase family protein [Eubacterium sp.]
MFTIGIYPRKSVYRDNSDSVSVQIQLCKDYAGIIFKDKDIDFKIYDKDEGFSGKNTNRPSFQELMEDVQNNTLDVVMVYKLDRISRNVQEFSAMYDIFQQHNVSFVSVKESFDTTTPMGRTVMYILAAFAQLERENTSERVTDNMHALGASGKWTGGKLPTGMTSVRRQIGQKEHSYLMIDKTIWLVKKLYELILQGYPITRIERYCRDNGIKSQSGKFLNTSQIYNIITNPVYCQNSIEAYYYFQDLGCTLPDAALFDGKKGLIGYGKTKTGKQSQKKQEKADWIIAIGIHDYVMPAADWIAAQSRLGINKMLRTAKYDCGILKGVIRCKCGARMDVRTYTKNGLRFSYYYCTDMFRQGKAKCNTGYVRIEQVEEAFLKQLRQIRFNPDGFKLRPDSSDALQSISSIKEELKQAQSAIDNLTAALTNAMDSPAAAYIITKIEELDKNKKMLETNLRKATLQENADKSLAETESYIYENICYLLDNFDSIAYTGKNELIRKIIKTCVLEEDSLHISF